MNSSRENRYFFTVFFWLKISSIQMACMKRTAGIYFGMLKSLKQFIQTKVLHYNVFFPWRRLNRNFKDKLTPAVWFQVIIRQIMIHRWIAVDVYLSAKSKPDYHLDEFMISKVLVIFCLLLGVILCHVYFQQLRFFHARRNKKKTKVKMMAFGYKSNNNSVVCLVPDELPPFNHWNISTV